MIKWRGETTMGLVSWLRWWHGELKPLQGGRDARVGLGLCERRRLRKCAHKYDGELEVSVMLLRSSVRKTKPYTSWMVLIQGWRWQLISIFCGPKDWNAASLSHISDVRPPQTWLCLWRSLLTKLLPCPSSLLHAEPGATCLFLQPYFALFLSGSSMPLSPIMRTGRFVCFYTSLQNVWTSCSLCVSLTAHRQRVFMSPGGS